jgi:hypothetical protein
VPFTTYSELKTAVAGKIHRELTDSISGGTIDDAIEDAIALAEAEMQTDCKLVDFETDSSIVVTAGSGSLPTGFLGFRSLYWDGDTKQPMSPVSPAYFDGLRNDSGGYPHFYAISGSTLRVNEGATGTAIGMAHIRFTPLSDSNTSNALLTNHPDAYLYGTIKHMAFHVQDDSLLQKAGMMFNAAKDRITSNNKDRKHAGPLTVRPR